MYSTTAVSSLSSVVFILAHTHTYTTKDMCCNMHMHVVRRHASKARVCVVASRYRKLTKTALFF